MERLSVGALFLFAVIASGCAAQATPDPVVVSSEQRQGVLDVVQGQTIIEADIRNNGGPGNITATATILDENKTVLDRASERFFMQANETRRIQIQTEVPPEAESYNLSVEPAQ